MESALALVIQIAPSGSCAGNLPSSKSCYSRFSSLRLPISASIAANCFSFGNGSRNRSSTRVRAEEENVPEEGEEQASVPVPPERSTGVGFGSKQRSGGKKKTRSSVIRRSPVENPPLLFPKDDAQSKQTENAFLLTWLSLGVLILIEGIALAASGFLPEEWDSLFVKYLYPSFTPTVFVFVGGTVAYGVLKSLRGEQGKSPK